MRILVTGGVGYIGLHTCIELLNSGHSVIVIDNLSNSKLESLQHVADITSLNLNIDNSIIGTEENLVFIKADIRDYEKLKRVFDIYPIDFVFHFAGKKSPKESIVQPLDYYHNNVFGSLVLLQVMRSAEVKNIIFSSSATIYGDTDILPIKESSQPKPTNPYGKSKAHIEQMLHDIYLSDDEWSIAILRYFNPIGAHKCGKIGDQPIGDSNNLLPVINKVVSGEINELLVYGGNYNTHDGTGIRDYIHVVDIANGHLAALKYLLSDDNSSIITLNLGTGAGYSVLEVILAYEKVSGRKIPYKITEPREGDVAQSFADPSYAQELLSWECQFNLEKMCEDSWNFQKNQKP